MGEGYKGFVTDLKSAIDGIETEKGGERGT